MKRFTQIAALLALGAVLTTSAAYADHIDQVQAPRSQDIQAPRSQDIQAPRSQDEVQAPRG